MNKTRLEAFSDGVFAIIITIMVLELKIPESTDWAVIEHLLPVLGSYILSFLYVAIYWGNHHHLLHTAKRVTPGIIWANMHLLFWLSLIPFFTGWMGVNKFDNIAVAAYGAILTICGLAYGLLLWKVSETHKNDNLFDKAFTKTKTKQNWSTFLYISAIAVAMFVNPYISVAMYAIVAMIWFIPAREIEEAVDKEAK